MILSIDTSCDETSVAITKEHRVISNVLYSQAKIHSSFGGVYPIVAKREHEKKIQPAIKLCLQRARVSPHNLAAIAVTFGPGLAPALEIGLKAAKNLAQEFHLPLIPVDHIEGHIYSPFAQNTEGHPDHEMIFPHLAFVVSGGHTELVLMDKHIHYQILGETQDDAAGEALDKAARLLGLGYPGGPIIERLSQTGNGLAFTLPVPMVNSGNLHFSYSGLKTAFKRVVEALAPEAKLQELPNLAASFQTVLFKSLLIKLEQTLKEYPVKTLSLSGGVSANKALRKLMRQVGKKHHLPIYFPHWKNLTTDNAAMIGIAAHHKLQKGLALKDNFDELDRIPRASLNHYLG